MARFAALALCLCAVLAVAAAKPAPAPRCSAGSPVAGGWQVPEAVPNSAFAAVVIALVEGGASNSTWVPCDEPAVTLEQACSQVVAGTNYILVATLACPEVASTVEVRAEVFEPLPSAANAEPEVTALEILSVDGMGLIPSEVIIPKAA